MKGSEATADDLYQMYRGGNRRGHWVMTATDREAVTRKFNEGHGLMSAMYGLPVEIREGEDGIELVPDDVPEKPGLLTPAEHAAMDLTAQLWNALCGLVGNGSPRDGDLRELADAIHTIQGRILSQAAGRAYPGRYRLLGQSLVTGEPT